MIVLPALSAAAPMCLFDLRAMRAAWNKPEPPLRMRLHLVRRAAMKTTGRAVFDKLGFYLPPHHANASWHSAVVLSSALRISGSEAESLEDSI